MVQSAVAEPSPVFDEEYHGPDQGSLGIGDRPVCPRLHQSPPCARPCWRRCTATTRCSACGTCALTDPVAKFLTSAQARTTAHDYLYAGVQRRLGRPLQPRPVGADLARIPQQGRVSDWVKQTKRVLAGR